MLKSKFFVYYAPEIEDQEAYCVCPVCHSVLLSETLTLLITFEQWVLELWYFTWIFPVIRFFRGYHCFLSCDLDFGSLIHFLKTLTLLLTFEQQVLELWYFTWIFPVIRPLRGYYYFLPFDLGVWPIILKTLTLLITFEQWELELWYFTWVFLVIRPFRGYHYFFYPVTLNLEFDLFFEN